MSHEIVSIITLQPTNINKIIELIFTIENGKVKNLTFCNGSMEFHTEYNFIAGNVKLIMVTVPTRRLEIFYK